MGRARGRPPTAQDPQIGQFWVKKWTKMVLPKKDPDPFGKVNGAYLGYLGPVLIRVAPLKAQFRLEGLQVCGEGGVPILASEDQM